MRGTPLCRLYVPAPRGMNPDLCLPARIRPTPHTRRNGCSRLSIRLGTPEWVRAFDLRRRHYQGAKMPWYPHTYSCDECPNPSRGLVQACLWGRVRRVVREPALESAYLSRVYGPLFSGLP